MAKRPRDNANDCDTADGADMHHERTTKPRIGPSQLALVTGGCVWRCVARLSYACASVAPLQLFVSDQCSFAVLVQQLATALSGSVTTSYRMDRWRSERISASLSCAAALPRLCTLGTVELELRSPHCCAIECVFVPMPATTPVCAPLMLMGPLPRIAPLEPDV